MKKSLALLCLGLACILNANAQVSNTQQQYQQDLKIVGRQFSQYFYPRYMELYGLTGQQFSFKIDSARKVFTDILAKYTSSLPPAFVADQSTEIKYYFDKLLIDYPVNNATHYGKKVVTNSPIIKRLEANLADFNNPTLLKNSDFTNYVKAYFEFLVSTERNKAKYQQLDNQHLTMIWDLIPKYISSNECRQFWKADYLSTHIENDGIKNIEKFYADFKSTNTDTARVRAITTLYREDSLGRQGHLVKTYKTIGATQLDMHLFLPEKNQEGNKKPVIIYFHGGSWSEGKPDWFFYACELYAKMGFVACAVEYRTFGRHGTLPFEAVKDARSAIRWLRKNAEEFHIDTNRIVASGNSAGGHLILCTALADKWNEKTDDLNFSPVPNLLLVNAGVYDLTDQTTSWIKKDLKDKDLVKQISPLYLIKKDFPTALLLHGTKDANVPIEGASSFVTEMKRIGNTSITFNPLEGAGHFIWIDQKYSPEVSKLRTDFLKKAGYP